MQVRIAPAATVVCLLSLATVALASPCVTSSDKACAQQSALQSNSSTPNGGAAAYRGMGEKGSESIQLSFLNRVAPIPEPGTLTLLGTGLIGLGSVLRRRLRAYR